jgi:glutamate-1-semialdehyde 2,1-aminomutase
MSVLTPLTSALTRFAARRLRQYDFDSARFFAADGASAEIAETRRAAFLRLSERLRHRSPETARLSTTLSGTLSDLQFTNSHRVPFPFAAMASRHLPSGSLLTESRGDRLVDADGYESFDVSGSYGLNVFGYEFYKTTLAEGMAAVSSLGPVLGHYHPVVLENVRRLAAISGLDEVSFHMSGTEAVMQAVRLARFNTGRKYLVRFKGAYHGWWDGVQPGLGNPRPPHDVLTLRESDPKALGAIRSRRDIACVLVNPIQAMHPNADPPSDGALLTGVRQAGFNRAAYATWLKSLREACDRTGTALVLDEVFVGFRLARGGAQEYFDVRADMVTYGKTLGGGLPVGVLCGKRALMRRFDPDHPARLSLARGTFSAHPAVMGAMDRFLSHIERPEVRDAYAPIDARWTARFEALNQRLEEADVPVRVAHIGSIACLWFTRPSRYHWMLQYYLRAEGLALSWIGTGRLIFSHVCPDGEFEQIAARIVRAAVAMNAGAWWAVHQTAGDIRRLLLREALSATFSGRPRRSRLLVRDDGIEQVTS